MAIALKRSIEKVFNESQKDPQIPLFLSASGVDIDFFTRQPKTPTWIIAEFANINLEELTTYAEQEYPKSPIMNQVEGWIGDRCCFAKSKYGCLVTY